MGLRHDVKTLQVARSIEQVVSAMEAIVSSQPVYAVLPGFSKARASHAFSHPREASPIWGEACRFMVRRLDERSRSDSARATRQRVSLREMDRKLREKGLSAIIPAEFFDGVSETPGWRSTDAVELKRHLEEKFTPKAP